MCIIACSCPGVGRERLFRCGTIPWGCGRKTIRWTTLLIGDKAILKVERAGVRLHLLSAYSSRASGYTSKRLIRRQWTMPAALKGQSSVAYWCLLTNYLPTTHLIPLIGCSLSVYLAVDSLWPCSPLMPADQLTSVPDSTRNN